MNIGATLRDRRKELGKSLEEIESSTKIRSRYLEALEMEEWDIFPGKVYLKGFLRNYSRYLGLDEAEIVNGLPPIYNHEEHTGPLPGKIEIPGRPRRKVAIILAVIAVFLLFSAQYIYRNYFNAPLIPDEQTNVTQNNPPQSPPAIIVPPEENNPPVQPEEPKTIVDKMNLTIQSVEGKCWIEIKTGKTLVYEGTLTKGKEISFPDLASFSITLGNAGGVAIYINNVDIGSQGGIGDVVRKTFTIENNEIKEITS